MRLVFSTPQVVTGGVGGLATHLHHHAVQLLADGQFETETRDPVLLLVTRHPQCQRVAGCGVETRSGEV